MADLVEHYRAAREGRAPRVDPPVPYSRCITFIEGRDRAASARYWRDELAGYRGVATLPSSRPGPRPAYRAGRAEYRLRREPDARAEPVRARARRHDGGSAAGPLGAPSEPLPAHVARRRRTGSDLRGGRVRPVGRTRGDRPDRRVVLEHGAAARPVPERRTGGRDAAPRERCGPRGTGTRVPAAVGDSDRAGHDRPRARVRELSSGREPGLGHREGSVRARRFIGRERRADPVRSEPHICAVGRRTGCLLLLQRVGLQPRAARPRVRPVASGCGRRHRASRDAARRGGGRICPGSAADCRFQHE